MKLLVLLLLIAPVALADEAEDTVELWDGTVLHGRVVSCGENLRFAPVGSAELLLARQTVREVTLASGELCILERRRSNPIGGIAAMVGFPVLGFLLGGVLGSQNCGSDDKTRCALGGALIGFGAGLILGTTIYVASTSFNDRAPPRLAPGPAKRPVALSLTIRF